MVVSTARAQVAVRASAKSPTWHRSSRPTEGVPRLRVRGVRASLATPTSGSISERSTSTSSTNVGKGSKQPLRTFESAIVRLRAMIRTGRPAFGAVAPVVAVALSLLSMLVSLQRLLSIILRLFFRRTRRHLSRLLNTSIAMMQSGSEQRVPPNTPKTVLTSIEPRRISADEAIAIRRKAEDEEETASVTDRLDRIRDRSKAQLDGERIAFAIASGLTSEEYASLPGAQRRQLLALALDNARKNTPEMSTRQSATAKTVEQPVMDDRPIAYPLDDFVVRRTERESDKTDARQPATATKPRETSLKSIIGKGSPGVRGGWRGISRSNTQAQQRNVGGSSGGSSDDTKDDPDRRQRAGFAFFRESYLQSAESLNGRLAALGFIMCLAREVLEPGHPTLYDQVEDVLIPIAQHAPPFLVAVCDRLVDLVL